MRIVVVDKQSAPISIVQLINKPIQEVQEPSLNVKKVYYDARGWLLVEVGIGRFRIGSSFIIG